MVSPNNKKTIELSEGQERILENNITWLFGVARGGTSWLALQLLSHNTFRINEFHLDDHLSTRANEYHEDIVRRIDNPQKNPDYFFSNNYRDVWMFYLRKLILHRIYAQVKEISKKIIIKELVAHGATDVLADCLKHSKIIILLRDGRDVIDSLFDARGTEGFMTEELKLKKISNKQEFILKKSKGWIKRTENLLKTYKSHPENLRYLIKYEDLRKNTLEELEKIYKFLEIDISKDELQKIVNKFSFENIPDKDKGKGKFARSATPGKWKENFNESEKKIMNEIMSNKLKELGYE